MQDLSPIAEQRALEQLHLRECAHLTDVDVLGQHEALRLLSLNGADLGQDGCARIAAAFPRVNFLDLSKNEWIERLDGLADLSPDYLMLQRCLRLRDLGPLAMFSKLVWLDLSGVSFTDLNPLAGLSKLQTLSLLAAPDPVDLIPLAGLRDLNIRLFEGQRVLGADRLHKSTEIIWMPRRRA